MIEGTGVTEQQHQAGAECLPVRVTGSPRETRMQGASPWEDVAERATPTRTRSNGSSRGISEKPWAAHYNFAQASKAYALNALALSETLSTQAQVPPFR